MTIIETKIPDLLIIEPQIFSDERGYFFEVYNQKTFKENGLNYQFVQDNEALSSYGVVRGLHMQKDEFSQAKLVRITQGRVIDVALDLRPNSPTFLQWETVELSAENKRQFLIPRGFAHGYSVLEDQTIFAYKCDNAFNKASEEAISPLDSDLKIDWQVPLDKMILSEKDRNNSPLKDYLRKYHD